MASAVTTARIRGGTSLEKNCTTTYPAAVTTSTIHGWVRRKANAPQVTAAATNDHAYGVTASPNGEPAISAATVNR